MLKSIIMKGVASYSDAGVEFNELDKVNIIFGSNGTGKTTISTFLKAYAENIKTGTATPDKYKDCSIQWGYGQPAEIMVYNRQFKKENIGATRIPGVFLMGKRSVDNQAEIDKLEQDYDSLQGDLSALDLKIKQTDESYLPKGNIYNQYFSTADSQILKEAEVIYKDSLKGIKLKQDSRLNTIMGLYSNIDPNSILSEEEVKRHIAIVSESDTAPLQQITNHKSTLDRLASIEQDQIFAKVIVGSGDIDFAGFVNSFGLSDWVRQGKNVIDGTNGICPFCQQHTISEDFINKLNGYFDESYENDVNTIGQLSSEYANTLGGLIDSLNVLCGNTDYTDYIDAQKLNNIKDALKELLKSNLVLMNNKSNSPSDKIELTSGSHLYEEFNDYIVSVNGEIEKRNSLITQKKKIKASLGDNVLKMLILRYKDSIDKYANAKEQATIESDKLKKDRLDIAKKIEKIETSISALRAQSSDSTAAVERINKTLERYQFNSFRLKNIDESSYCLVRENGDIASETLSEGEETLITFLYYLQLLKGSTVSGVRAKNVIAVIDDPICSLDNSILSHVSREIKNLIFEVGKDKTNIAQLIILSHNIIFHKSLSRAPICSDNEGKHKKFYILAKDLKSNKTYLENFSNKDNVESEYNELWKLLRKAYKKILEGNDEEESKDYKYTVQNTMRRIYESFFEQTCKFRDNQIAQKYYEIESSTKLENEDKSKDFRDLIEWMNQGSHSADMDDIKDLPNKEQIKRYIATFRSAFEVTGNLGQYEKLMG